MASQTASLTIVVFDASAATEWVPTRPAATKAQFTGTPAEVMRGLAKGEDFTAVDVGRSSGFAFELEGKSGRLEAYRLADGTLALVAPPRDWWLEAAHPAAAVDQLFDDVLGAAAIEDATEIGELELTSGKLAAVYVWHKKVGAARELATTVPAGGALAFGDGYGGAMGGLIVDLSAGRYALTRRELAAPWAPDQALVAVYLVAQG